MTKLQQYECCNCGEIFRDKYYNWYVYYKEKAFHSCPCCKSKLVPYYDFNHLAFLDSASILFFILMFIVWGLNSYFGLSSGNMIIILLGLIGGTFHAIYRHIISLAEKVILQTRIAK